MNVSRTILPSRIVMTHRYPPTTNSPIRVRLMLSDDVDSSHHAVVLVLDVVAVEQIATSVPAPAHDDLHLFAIFNCDRIFPATFLTERLPPVPGQHLERHKMGVNG